MGTRAPDQAGAHAAGGTGLPKRRPLRERARPGKSFEFTIPGLTAEQAEERESEWIFQDSETLANRGNRGRKTDFEDLERFHRLQRENRDRVAATMKIVRSHPDLAFANVYEALRSIEACTKLKTDGGTAGALLEEENAENGYSGELVILERLTRCRVRPGCGSEARAVA